MQTILITGCSSGFGLETARYFLERGWNVIATMRSPRDVELPDSPLLRVLALDVCDAEGIRQVAESAGPIDVLVNNAGVGLLSVFEGTPMAAVRSLFETNTFGAMALTQAFLPQFTSRRSGLIVNVSSSVTLMPLPMLATYTASKAALNAFTECLALELAPFDVRVRLVLPGQSPETPFGQNARALMEAEAVRVPEPYADFASAVIQKLMGAVGPLTHARDVAEAIWRAANDPACPIRQPAGADAVAVAGSQPR